MKVRELVIMLQKHDPDLEVYGDIRGWDEHGDMPPYEPITGDLLDLNIVTIDDEGYDQGWLFRPDGTLDQEEADASNIDTSRFRKVLVI